MKTQTGSYSAAATEAEILSPTWYYDAVMQEIEPELTSGNIKNLQKKYEGETEEDFANRMQHYEYSFDIFDQCVAELDLETQMDAAQLKEGMLEVAVTTEQTDRQKAIADIEGALERSDFRA